MATLQSESPRVQELQTQSFKLASPIVLALMECDDELRTVAKDLLEQLASGELDKHEEQSTCALLAEILFPNADASGIPGLDLLGAEAIAIREHPEAAPILAAMDRQESTFAERLRDLMATKGITQVELAEKVGIGQPAISMMLNRTCRPQKKTVQKLAMALEVAPTDLWPA